MPLTCEEREKCGSIIRGASEEAARIGSGMLPPWGCTFVLNTSSWNATLLVPIQTRMITALGTVFSVNLTESAAEGLCVTLSASCIEHSEQQISAWLIPILVNVFNARKAAKITEAIGWLAVEHFQTERDGEKHA